MTVFMQRDGGTAGTGSVFPDRAGAHLIAISNFDAGYGETPGPAPNLIQVVYTRSPEQTGPCPTRLDQLVNTDFAGTPGNIDILVVAADINFTLNDGSMLVGGFNIPPNTMSGGVNLNPTNSSLVIYDTSDNGGTGICLQREGGDLDLESPASVILYHELSHALRTCTNATLDRTETDCTDASDEEAAAIVDENDMRDQLGLDRRQPDNHCGSLGCTSTCCVVASIACGSPFAGEVNALREIRDRTLRRSEVGFDFFEHLHLDYYRLSPRIVDRMGTDPALRTLVRTHLVRPLVTALRLVHAHAVEHAAPAELEERLDAEARGWRELEALGAAEFAALHDVITSAVEQRAPVRPSRACSSYLDGLASVLDQSALDSPYVRWALVDVLLLLVQALERRALGTSDGGRQLAAAIDAWSARLPVTPIWATLSRHELVSELLFLGRTLLREPPARREFARRLIETCPDEPRIREAVLELQEEDGSWMADFT